LTILLSHRKKGREGDRRREKKSGGKKGSEDLFKFSCQRKGERRKMQGKKGRATARPNIHPFRQGKKRGK